MPFQPINYAAIRPTGYPELRSLPQLIQSIQQEQDRRQQLAMQAEREKRAAQESNLENSIRQAQLPYAAEHAKLQNELLRSQAYKAMHPLSDIRPSGDLANELYLQQLKNQQGEENPQYKALRDVFESEKHRKDVTTERNQKLANAMNFRLLPTDAKRQSLAIAAGLGLTPEEAGAAFASGESLQDLSKKVGIPLKDVTPVYPLAGENIKRTQQRGAYIAELNSLNKNISEAMAPYSEKFIGYSPKQIIDSFKKDKISQDNQAKYLAARALGPEMSTLRLNAAQGRVGIQAIKELTDKALGNSKIFEANISPEVYKKMQSYIDKWITNASDAWGNTLGESARIKSPEEIRSQGMSDFGTHDDPLGLRG